MSGDGDAPRAPAELDGIADESEPAGRESNRNPVVHWLFVSGDRWGMAWTLSVGATLAFVAADQLGIVGVASSSLVATTFTAAITGVFTIVAVTVSINQLVLSRVMGPPDKIRSRAESVTQFRAHLEEMSAETDVSPAMPAKFLAAVLRTLGARTEALQEAYRDDHDPEGQAAVRELTATLQRVCEEAESDLSGPDLSLFRTLSPILTNEFSQYRHAVDQIRATSDGLTDAEERALHRVAEALDEVNVTRQYVKTLYVHQELATVSRLILLTGLPAVLVSMGIILLYSADTVFLGQSALLVVVSAGLGVVLLPLNVLFAYGLRIGTIAKMTTTFGTFTPVEEIP